MYDDVRMAAKCGPDTIYRDGAEGSTGAGPHIATGDRHRADGRDPGGAAGARDVGLADDIDLIVAGIRNGADVASAWRSAPGRSRSGPRRSWR